MSAQFFTHLQFWSEATGISSENSYEIEDGFATINLNHWLGNMFVPAKKMQKRIDAMFSDILDKPVTELQLVKDYIDSAKIYGSKKEQKLWNKYEYTDILHTYGFPHDLSGEIQCVYLYKENGDIIALLKVNYSGKIYAAKLRDEIAQEYSITTSPVNCLHLPATSFSYIGLSVLDSEEAEEFLDFDTVDNLFDVADAVKLDNEKEAFVFQRKSDGKLCLARFQVPWEF